jgi:uncharacterized protein YegJ (DUF2314 family)
MARKDEFALVVILFIAVSFAGCSSGGGSASDPITSVEENDPEMNAAIARARAELPTFWQKLEHPGPGESDFALKVKITDSHGVEHFWLTDLQGKDGKLTGTINNDPQTVQNVKLGDRIPIPEADITDWMYTRNGKMYGNGTVRPLLKRMPPEEAAKIKEMLAEP